MFEIAVKSPTRVDLSGGTLDCWPLYLFLTRPVTVNIAVDIFTYAELKERNDQKIELVSTDLKSSKTYENLAACLSDHAPEFDLVRAHLRFWQPKTGFRLATRSESPVGGGLGGSSSLCISLLKAMSAWAGKTIEPYEMVRIASHLEAQVLMKPTGTQDYFPAIFGGLSCIHYEVPGPRIESHPVPSALFRERFLLVYTGRSHHSGINNWQVIKQWLDGDQHVRSCLEELSAISFEMRDAVLNGGDDRLPDLFAKEYQARTNLSSGFSSPEIRRLSEIAKSHGAVAKICGAGGGGCVLVWCHDRNMTQVQTAIERDGFTVLPAQPWAP